MKRVLAWALVIILCLGMFAGCKKNETDPTDGLNVVDTSGLEAALEYIKTVYRKPSETTPKDFQRIAVVPVNGVEYEVVWSVDVDASSVKVLEPKDGMVTIDINEESKEEVPYVLTATISDAAGNSVSHSWNHILPAAISAEDMLEIVKAAYALASGESMGYDVTLVGKITMIKTPYDPSYKNITVVMVVGDAEDMPIECYRLKGEGCEDLKVGDTITVTGMLKNYNGTIEFDAGCSLDAVVKGEEIKAPEDPKQIVDEAYALGANKSLPYEATLTGVITEVGTPYNAQYGNVTVTIEVEGREGKPIVCYRLKGDGADKIGVNDLITVKGYITNYVGDKGKSTIEFTAGCQLLKWEDRAAPTQPSDPKAVVDQAYALGANATLKYEATLTGKVTKVNTPYDPAYGNVSVTLVIEGRESKPILCYRMKGTGADVISIGDTITVKGYITNYVGDKGYSTIEYNYPTLVSYKKNTAVAPTDSLEIVKAAYQLKVGEQLPYEATVTGKITEVNSPYDIGYKNLTVTIVVEGGETMPIKCYRLKGEGADQIGVGDTITVKGYIENYQHTSGDTEVEFVQGCELVSWQNTGADTPEAAATPISIADAIAKGTAMEHNTYTTEKYSVTGKITEVYSTMYGNMKLTDEAGNILTIYGTYDPDGNRYDAMTTKPVAGDTVTIEGPIGQYNGTPQIKNGVIVAHTPGTETPEQPEPPTPPQPPVEPTESLTYVDAPVVGTAYKFVLMQNGLGKELGITGEMSGFYYGTTETISEMVDVYLEEATGGYRIYFLKGNDKTYLNVIPRANDATKTNVVLQTIAENAEPSVYELNTEFKYVKTSCVGAEWYLGTYGTNSTISASKTSYIEDTSKIGVSQFVTWFATVETTDVEPEEPEQPVESLTYVDAPVVGTAYKFVLMQNGLGKELGITGEMSGFYYGTTETISEMVDVYLEEATGGYRIYFLKGNDKTYLNVIPRANDATKTNVVLQTIAENAEPSVYELNTEFKYVKTSCVGAEWYLGTYGTNITISASKTSYIEDTSKIGVSQFVTWFATAQTTGGTEPEQPETEEPESLTLKKANEMGAAMEHNTYTTDKYMVTGIITEVYQTTYGNMKITDATGEILTIYGTYNADGSVRYDALEGKPVAGDLVTILGPVGQYSGNPQIKNGWIVAHTAATSVKDAIAIGAAMEHNTYTTQKHVVTGVITEVYQTTYGNMKIKDAEGNILTVYGTYNEDGTKRYDALEVKPAAGDTVTLYGGLGQYDGTPQMKNGWILVHTAAENEETAGVEVSFSNTANRTELTTAKQVWVMNGVTVTNEKGASTSNVADYSAPARFYKSSTLTIAYPGMTKIVFTCNNATYANDLVSSITSGTATADGKVVTLELEAAADSYTIQTLAAQVRVDSLRVFAGSASGSQPGGTEPNPGTGTGSSVVAATFTFPNKENPTAQGDGSAYAGKEYTDNGYTLKFEEYDKFYAGGYNLAGTGFVKFGSSKAPGTATIKVPAEVTKVVLHLAGYKDKTSKYVINGGEAVVLTTSTNTNEYDVVEIDTTTNKTITISTTSDALRMVMYSVVYYKAEG